MRVCFSLHFFCICEISILFYLFFLVVLNYSYRWEVCNIMFGYVAVKQGGPEESNVNHVNK